MAQAGKGPGMSFDPAQFGDFGAGSMESMTEAGRKLMETTARVNQEIFDFVNQRLSEDVAAQQKLMQSKSFEDIQKVYADYFQTASEQYMGQFQKLMSMAADSAKNAAKQRK